MSLLFLFPLKLKRYPFQVFSKQIISQTARLLAQLRGLLKISVWVIEVFMSTKQEAH